MTPSRYNPHMQQKQDEWRWQWEHLEDDNKWLFEEWIAPHTLESFRGKTVLDCGCGGGQHAMFTAPYAKRVLGVDLNASEIARKRNAAFPNVEIREADLAQMDLGEQFDVVYCIGVIHHTDDPDATFRNIARHCKPGGRVIVWCYSHEGNFLNRTVLETLKRWILLRLPRSINLFIAHLLTMMLYPVIYTIYLLPLKFLPFYEYFQNWRRLGYERNMLNVFDKLNAPQTWFITRRRIEGWFSPDRFADIHISPYKGVSWRGSGTLLH